MFLRIFVLILFVIAFVDADGVVEGGEVPMDKKSKEVKQFVEEIIKKYNNEISDPNYYVPIEVLKATEQMVAGSLIRIKLRIGKSNCKKEDVVTAHPKSCDTLYLTANCVAEDNGPTKEINVEILLQPWMHAGYLYTFV
uniref:Cystatin domain-containing protein n=1 Tax=Panagrolaimus sp. PS1159 TaxID=55785 RepID=A0AC35GIA8_9BILA